MRMRRAHQFGWRRIAVESVNADSVSFRISHSVGPTQRPAATAARWHATAIWGKATRSRYCVTTARPTMDLRRRDPDAGRSSGFSSAFGGAGDRGERDWRPASGRTTSARVGCGPSPSRKATCNSPTALCTRLRTCRFPAVSRPLHLKHQSAARRSCNWFRARVSRGASPDMIVDISSPDACLRL